MFDLERAIGEWLRAFNKYRAFDEGTLREMELHLRDHIDDLLGSGLDEEQAFRQAAAEFGEITPMAEEEFSNIRRNTLRSILFTTMLNNYFKTSFRSLMKSPLSSFINVFGLSVALGICLEVYAFFEFDKSLDRFHENKDRVFLTTFFVDRDGKEEQYGTTPTPLGERLRQDFASVEKVCRVKDQNVVMKHEDKVFHETVRQVDPTFLEMFTFPLKWGVSRSLADVNSIILSEAMALKYFGEENPVGESIQMIFSKGLSKTFTVKGVAQAFPDTHIIDFDFLINYENTSTSDPRYNPADWGSFINATLIQVEDPSAIRVIKKGMDQYRKLQNQEDHDWAITSFEFVSLHNLHLASKNIRDGISHDYNGEARLGLPIIAVFMLVLACFNYINIAVVSAAKRIKEIGMRKVIGARRFQLVIQFLSENVFITFFALLLGLILAVSVFIPWFRDQSGDPVHLDLIHPELWIFLVVVVLFTGVASGIYPALYISRFEAVSIFKGTLRFGRKNRLTKLFLAIQLIMTCAGITCAVVFVQNNTFQNNKSWGYNQHQSLYAPVEDQLAFEQLKAALIQYPEVLTISGSSHHLGKGIATAVVHLPDRNYEVRQLAVDDHYFETMGVELIDGRGFNKKNDRQAIVVNEQLVENMTLKNPIGQVLKIDSVRYEIVGVAKDFHIYNFYDAIRPTIFNLAREEDYQYLSLKARKGSESEAYHILKAQWADLFPEIPFQGGYQSDVWVGYFEQLDTAERFYKVMASIAVMLASLGLYGLVSLNLAGRVREFSIRKVLGAGMKNLASAVAGQYILLVVISLIVGIPFSYWLAEASLVMLYAYPMPMTASGLLISIVLLVMVLAGVVSTQVRKVTKANPVDGLKVE